MAAINRVILIGRLTADPDHKFTPSGVSVASFRVAIDRPQNAEARKNGDAKQTDFIPCVAWRQTTDYVKNYLSKGRLVSIDGRMQVREYTDKEGQKRRETEVICENVGALDRAKEGNDRQDERQEPHRAPQGQQRAQPAAGGGFDDDMSDPFADG